MRKTVISLLSLVSTSLLAVECSVVFPDAASSFSETGSVTFANKGQLIGSDGLIDFETIIDDTKNNGPSCDAQFCVSTGDTSEPLTLAPFQTSPANVTEVVPSNSSATLTGGLYRSITVNSNSTLNLVPGIYWVEQFRVESNATVNVLGDGVITLFTQNAVIGPGSEINLNGSAEQSLIVSYGEITLLQGAEFKGFLYAQTSITVSQNAAVTGGVATPSLTMQQNSSIAYDADAVDAANFAGACEEAAEVPAYYRLVHDGQGLTCEAENMQLTACADEACSAVLPIPANVILEPPDWGAINISFIGETAVSLTIRDPGTYTISMPDAVPVAPLVCEPSCDIEFVDAGLAFFNATTGTSTLADQIAETPLASIGIKAVRDDNGVCAALVQGTQEVSLGYDCISPTSDSYSPDMCRVPFADIPVNGDGTGYSDGTVTLEFDASGQATLSDYSYPDVGRLALRASAEIDGATFTSGQSVVDVIPYRILMFASGLTTPKHIAGDPFTLRVFVLGALGNLMPGYQPGQLQLSLQRTLPAPDGVEGELFYSANDSITSQLNNAFSDVVPMNFSNGRYQYSEAYYTEVGAATLGLKDNNYLGNELTVNPVNLGQFRPAYFDIIQVDTAELGDAHGPFTYVGQTFGFVSGAEPVLQITAKNAREQTTNNYADALWQLLPDQTDVESQINYMDSSGYAGTATVVSAGDAPLLSGVDVYDGQALLQINNAQFRYDKINTESEPYGPVEPFNGSIDMLFTSAFLTDGDGVCWQSNYPDGCETFTIDNIIGNSLRYGRLTLLNTYGPETETLYVPIMAEYFEQGEWRRNSLDDLTPINYASAAGQVELQPVGTPDISDLVGAPFATGLLNGGQSDANDLLLNAPGEGNTGTVRVSLVEDATDAFWSEFLNDDWDDDGDIDSDDFPSANVSFGLFRGNDRVIHWREVFE
ncbi:DUF6701 domain-containing protein [Aestuariibacter salexigens]|uniref:DUF6701 domain-containing protein n=1 Tax=Aestuariibacter salexigens TaxID=226010 RepID=UPI000405A357|nr:DUF6701 domain-containing protein [Aestuariibacter salexigens]